MSLACLEKWFKMQVLELDFQNVNLNFAIPQMRALEQAVELCVHQVSRKSGTVPTWRSYWAE